MPSGDQHRTVKRRRWISLGSGRTAIPHPGRTQPKLESTRSGEPTPRTTSGGIWTRPPTRRPRGRVRLLPPPARRPWPRVNRSLALTSTRLRPALAPRRRSRRQVGRRPSSKITPRGGRELRTSKRPVPEAIEPARLLVPPPGPRRKDLRAKAPVPLSDGSRPTQPRLPDRSPRNSAPIGQSMRHLTPRGPRLKHPHRTRWPAPSRALTPLAPSEVSSRGVQVARTSLSLRGGQRTPSRRPMARTPNLVSGEPEAQS